MNIPQKNSNRMRRATEKEKQTREAHQQRRTAVKEQYGKWLRENRSEELQAAGAEVLSRLTKLKSQTDQFAQRYTDRYANRKANSYVADSGVYLKDAEAQKAYFDSESDGIRQILSRYGTAFDSSFNIAINEALDSGRQQQGKILSTAKKDNDFWSRFPDENSYNQAREEVAYTQRALASDTVALTQELEALRPVAQEYAEKNQTFREYLLAPELSDLTKEQAQEMDRWLRGTEAQYGISDTEGMEALVKEKETFLDEATRLQTLAVYGAVADPESDSYDPEFAEKSKYIPQEYTPMSNMTVLTDNYELDGRYPWQDPLYEAINGNTQAQAWLSNRAAVEAPEDNALGRIFYRVAEGKHELLQMEDSEKLIYNYYANAGDSRAREYYELLETDLYARERLADAKYWAEEANRDPVGTSLFSISMSPLKGLSYVGQLGDYLDDGKIDENAPYNKFSYVHGDIRGTVAQKIEEGNWGKAGSWLYQQGMSMGDFLMSTAVTGGNSTAALLIMGSGAAADMTIDAKQRGLDDDQALALGTIAGAAEVVTEKMGLDALFDTALRGKSPLVYVLKNALSEGVEEPTSSLINLMADVIISKDKSQWQQSIQAYKDQGCDDTKAFWKAVTDQAASLGLDALGGFLSGSAIGGGSVAIHSAVQNSGYRQVGKAITASEGGVAALQALSAELGKTDADLAKLSAKISDKVAKGDTRQVGRLYAAVQGAVERSNTTALTNKLIEKGYETQTARRVAQVLMEARSGEVTSQAQAELLAALRGDETVMAALSETMENEDSSGYRMEQQLRQMVRGQVASEIATPAAQVRNDNKSIPQGKVSAVRTVTDDPQGDVQQGEDVTFVRGSGQALRNVKFASVEQGKATVEMEDGSTVSLSDVSFADVGQEMVAAGITGMEHVSVTSANGIWQVFRQGNYGSNAGEFTKAAMQTFRAGFMGDATVLKQGDSRSAALDPVHAEMIYQMGREDAEAHYKAQQAKVDAQKKAAAEKNSTAEKKGGVYYGYEGQTIDQRKVDKDHKRLTKAQRVGIDFVKRLAGKFGTQFYFYESYTDAQGNRVYKDRDGNVVQAEKGYYDPKDGSIHIDLTGDTILFTIAHELGHQIKDWSPKQFKKMADIVMEGFSSNDVPLDVLISQQQALAREHGRELTEDEAFEEVICNALEGVMADGKVAQFLQQIEGRDKSLGARVWRFFQDIAQLIRDTLDAYAGVSPGSVEGIMVSQLEDTYKQLQKALSEGIYYAGENFRQAEKNTTGEGGEVRFKINYDDAIDLLDSGELDRTQNTHLKLLDYTPQLYIDRADAKNLKIITGWDIAYLAMKKEGEIPGNYHGLGKEVMKKIPNALHDPLYIVKQPNGRIIAITEITVKGNRSTIVSLELDAFKSTKQDGEFESENYNLILTFMDAKPNYLKNTIFSGDIVYNKNNEDPANFILRLKSLKKAVPDDDLAKSSNQKIPHQEEEVKENDSAKSGVRTSIQEKKNPTVADMLKKEVEKLKGDVEKLKELLKLQRSITGGTKFTASSVEAAARVLKKSAGATGNTAELAGLLNRFYEYIATEQELTWEGVKEQAQAAVDWLQSHVKRQRSDYAQEILNQIHGSRIYLDESQKQEAAHRFGSFNAFRQAVMGSITVANEANTSLDSFWQEMSALYPDVFDAEMTAADMPGALADVIDRLRNEDTSLLEYAYNREMIEQDLVRQVYDTYWNVSTLRTFADVKQGQINRLKSEHLQRMQQLKAENRQKVEQMKEGHRAEVQMIRNAYRQRLDSQQKQIVQRYQESRAKAVEGRHKTEMRHKIQKVVKKLNDLLLKETKDKHVPEELKRVVAEALDAVNMDTVGAEERVARYDALIAEATDPDVIEALTQTRDRIQKQGDRMNERLTRLKDAYEELKDAEGDISNAYDEDLAEYIKELADEVGDTPLRDMTLAQLETVYEVYTAVLTTVRNANKAFKEAKGQSIREMGEAVLGELRALKQRDPEQSKAKLRTEEFFWNNEKPIYAFERIGSKVLSMLYRNLQAGQDTYMADQMDAKAFVNEQKKKHGYDKWDFEKRYEFTSSHGDSFQLSLSQIMSLYAYTKRDQAREHIRKGGIVFDSATELTKKGLLGVKKTVNVENSTAYNISDGMLAEICGSLTQQQAAFVDEMQRYLSDTMGAKGNEVSMELYGIRLFKEKHYFPLKSAPEYMEKAREQQSRQADIKLKNSGMTKATVPKASNPVVLTPFMDVWADHVVDMSMYHSFVLPLEDFYRVYNFKTGQALEEGQTVSVISAINRAHGKAASRYVDQFLKDLNGGVVADPRESIGKALVSKFKKASVMASASVVVQQPTAVIRALAMLDARHFFGQQIDKKKMAALWDEAKQYAPVAAVKEMGYFDTHMGRSARDYLLAKEYRGFGEMAKGVMTDGDYRDELLSTPAAMADQIAWVWIWNAVKRETGANNPNLYATDRAEFFRIAGERFTEVVSRTQVYDSVFSRSANMRSKSMWMNMVTSFMGEPTTSANMVESALRQWKQGDRKGAWKTACSVYGSVLVNALVVAAVYAMRDDDEDESFAEKYATAFAGKLLEGINPMTYFPIVRDVWSLMQGYDVERADMSVLSDLISGVERVATLMGKETADMSEEKLAAHNKKLVEAIMNLIDSGFSLAGIPEKNIRRDIMAMVNTWRMAVDGVEFDFGKLISGVLKEVKDNVPGVNMLPD